MIIETVRNEKLSDIICSRNPPRVSRLISSEYWISIRPAEPTRIQESQDHRDERAESIDSIPLARACFQGPASHSAAASGTLSSLQ